SEFNITVVEGPKRGLPAQSILQSVKQSGLMLIPLGLFLLCLRRGRSIHRTRVRTALKRLLCVAIVFSVAGGQWPLLRAQNGRIRLPFSPAKLEKKKAAWPSENHDKLPLSFEANQGQLDSQVKFISRANGYNLFLTSTEALFQFRIANCGLRNESPSAGAGARNPQSALLTMKLAGANPDARIRGLDAMPGRGNYFIGDAANWRANVPSYSRVEYGNVYRGIDLVYHGDRGELEYDFKVAPGADPAVIRLGFEGADKIEIDSGGELVASVADGEVRQRKPMVYQETGGTRQVIPSRFVLLGDQTSIGNPQSVIRNRTLGFEIGAYDKTRPLIIDPVLAYSTYFGGGGNEEGNSIAVDSAGNVYVTGFTDSINFPLANASQTNLGGGQQDAFVVKLDPTGTRLMYSTYIGGNGQDNGTSIAVDHSGNAYVTGFTDSTNFPLRNSLQPTKSGNVNAFVVKLDSAGSILNSTLFGGSVADFGSSVAVDSAGNVYVAGIATSPDIPMTNALQPTHGGLVDAYVAKIDSSGTRLVYSTYLGGSGIDCATCLAVDSAGNLYLAGLTSSRDFRTVGAPQATHGGGVFDSFVAKLNPSGTQIIYSTFLGGSGEDRAFRIAVDASGSAYVTGDTDSIDFPVMNALQSTRSGSSDAFVTKLNPNGSAFSYSTYLGGSGIDAGTAIAVDSGGSAHVTGFTGSNNFPRSAALQQAFGGGSFDAHTWVAAALTQALALPWTPTVTPE
ncbi:MAG: hypothetical protein DMF60_00210, partial [Acidobacteria bacterium]